MFAKDIMTPNVISVSPGDSVTDIAKLLIDRRISAAPVVDGEEKLIGIVSEGDLVHRVLGDHEQPRSWWLRLLGDPSDNPGEYVRSHGSTAADVMTKDVVTVTEMTSLAEVAELLESMKIKRVPVVRAGTVVGIVSRANIIQALISRSEEELPKITASDQEIRDQILAECNKHPWSGTATLNVIVTDGTVQLWGYVDSESAKKALMVIAENVSGVTDVKENLSISAASPVFV